MAKSFSNSQIKFVGVIDINYSTTAIKKSLDKFDSWMSIFRLSIWLCHGNVFVLILFWYTMGHIMFFVVTIDIKSLQNRLLKVCYVPATSAGLNRLLFFLFLLWPLTVLMKQTRQAVCAIKQSIYLDVYGGHCYNYFLQPG
jgi:hypothetical protein